MILWLSKIHWPPRSGRSRYAMKKLIPMSTAKTRSTARLIPKSAQIPSGRKPTSNGVTVAVYRIARIVIRSHRCAKRECGWIVPRSSLRIRWR